MKMSCLPVSLYAELSVGAITLDDWFRFAAELGLDGADVSVAHLANHSPAYLAGLRAEAEGRGLRIAMLVTYTDFTQPDAGERARQIAMLRAQIEVAAALGASFVRVTAGQARTDVTRRDGIAWAVDGLTACLDAAADAGVTLAYENHTRGYGWTQNDCSQPADIFLEIVRRTEGSGLRILFDTANTLAHGDDPLDVLARVLPRIAVVHVNDILRSGYFEPVIAGTGVAPISAMFEMLAEAAWDGWVSVEEASKQGKTGFRQGIAFAEQAWRDAGGVPRA